MPELHALFFQKTRRKGARRNGVITGIKKWPNGRIPYMISGQYTERERALLARSFQVPILFLPWFIRSQAHSVSSRSTIEGHASGSYLERHSTVIIYILEK